MSQTLWAARLSPPKTLTTSTTSIPGLAPGVIADRVLYCRVIMHRSGRLLVTAAILTLLPLVPARASVSGISPLDRVVASSAVIVTIVVNAPDMESATALLRGDPLVKANLFRGDVVPFRTALERGAPDPMLASAAETGKADLVQALLDVTKPSQKAIEDAYEHALEQKRTEVAAVLKKAGAREPAPAFTTDPKVLASYAGDYKSDTFPLAIKIFTRDGNLFMQAAGQGEFPLEARSATEFEFNAARVQVRFASDVSFTLTPGAGSYLFKKVPNR
jgi:hypothetical protein